jgi:hypothetical protein
VITESITVEREGLTLSSVLWARYKRLPDGLVESCLGLNFGLSANAEIPVGTVIEVPIEKVSASSEPAREVIRLWS